MASPVRRSCQAIHCTISDAVLNNKKAPVILFLLCLHVISVVQIFRGSHVVRSLNSGKSVTSMELYDVGKIELELRVVTNLSLRGQSHCSARVYMGVPDYQRLNQKLLINQEKQTRMLKIKVANRERSVVFT